MTNIWYREYISEASMDKEMLFRVLSAANYMSIRPLLDLVCLWFTFQLSGKTAEEVCWNPISLPPMKLLSANFRALAMTIQIRLLLNLPRMSPEEEARAREEHPWVFQNND